MTAVLIASYVFLFILIVALAIAFGGTAFRIIVRRFLRHQMLLVTVPHHVANRHGIHEDKAIDLSTELFERLHERGVQFSIETAVHGIGEEIHFYLVVPRNRVGLATDIITSLWTGVKVAHIDDYDLWLDGSGKTESGTPQNSVLSGGYLTQLRPYPITLKAPKKGNFDPFLEVLRVLSGVHTIGEGVAIQWVVKPAHPGLAQEVSRLINGFAGGRFGNPNKLLHEEFPVTPLTVNLLEQKVSAPLFAVNCRILTASTTPTDRLKKIGEAYASASQGIAYNELKYNKAGSIKKFLPEFIGRHFNESEQMILSARELSYLMRLPTGLTPAPKLKK